MKYFILLFIVLTPVIVFSQGIINNGAKIVVTPGAAIYVDGGVNADYKNLTFGTSNGTIDLDGKITLEGDFANNSTNATNPNVFINADSDGEVVFAGGTQSISNTNYFIDFEKVTINDGSTTSLLSGSAATVNGALLVNPNGKFYLSTPLNTNPSGSLITKSTITSTDADDIIVERYFDIGNRFQYFSTPVQNADVSQFSVAPGGYFNYNVYSYNENVDGSPSNTNYATWNNPAAGLISAWVSVANATPGTFFNDAVGYATYSSADLNINFQGGNGLLNNQSSYSPAVTFNANDGFSDYFDGWNLVGNPYPCALDWSYDDPLNLTDWTRTGISNSIYFWDGINYRYFNISTDDHLNYGNVNVGDTLSSNFIPAMQSFFVKATGAPTFTIPSAARVHASQAMYKSEEKEDVVNYDFIKLQTLHNSQIDETYIRFIEEATINIDDDFDAFKVYSTTEGLQQIYSLTEDTEFGIPMAINSLPTEALGTIYIPLGLYAKESGLYTIEAIELNNVLAETIFLVDNNNPAETKYINLNNNPTYSFYINEGEIRDRFYIFFSPNGTLPTNEEFINLNEDILIYSDFNNIYIETKNIKSDNNVVEIFNLLGQLIYQGNINSNFEVISINVQPGNYFVKLNCGENYFSKKVFLY